MTLKKAPAAAAAPSPAAAAKAAPSGPTLYAELVTLDRDRHRDLRLRPLIDQSAARAMNAVFCAAAEFAEACKLFPLLFIRNDGEPGATAESPAISPVCLLGLQNGQNLYVETDGAWSADYLPAFLRRYPFALVRSAPDAELNVAIDPQSPAWTGSAEGEPLFDEQGESTPRLETAIQFLKDFEEAAQQTRLIGPHLHSLGLLKEMRAKGPLPGGQEFSVDGFWVVDEARLRALPDEAVLALHRNGLLAVIHHHLVSLSNIRHLVNRRSAQLSA